MCPLCQCARLRFTFQIVRNGNRCHLNCTLPFSFFEVRYFNLKRVLVSNPKLVVRESKKRSEKTHSTEMKNPMTISSNMDPTPSQINIRKP